MGKGANAAERNKRRVSFKGGDDNFGANLGDQFAGKKGAEKALALSGAHMGKRYVDVRAAEAPNAFAPNKAVAQPLGCRGRTL